MAKLKVFRTPIGFHDAYVAAASQKAALEAWGSDADLFARGIAEQVTDAKLTAAALESPGMVIKVSRGNRDDFFKAAEPVAKKVVKTSSSPARSTRQKTSSARTSHAPAPAKEPAPAPRPRKPRPSRAALEKAEAALANAEREAREELADLLAQKQAIDEKRNAVRAAFEASRETLEQEVEEQCRAYRAKLSDWAAL